MDKFSSYLNYGTSSFPIYHKTKPLFYSLLPELLLLQQQQQEVQQQQQPDATILLMSFLLFSLMAFMFITSFHLKSYPFCPLLLLSSFFEYILLHEKVH